MSKHYLHQWRDIQSPSVSDLPGPIELLRERDEAIERVLAQHTKGEYPDLPYPICEQCSEDRSYQWWPCPTVQAITQDTPDPGA